jgi:hypothetical protein
MDDDKKSWLVVWNIFHFSIELGMSSSQLTKSYFSEGMMTFPTQWKNEKCSKPPTRIFCHHPSRCNPNKKPHYEHFSTHVFVG